MPFWNQSDARKSCDLTAPEAGSRVFFSHPSSFLCLQTERGLFLPLLLNLRVGRDARPRGRPHRSQQNAATIELSYPTTCVWESLCAPRFLRETFCFSFSFLFSPLFNIFLRDKVKAVRAAETSGSRNVGMEGADFDSPSPTGV